MPSHISCSPTSVVERNEAFFIRVWKPLSCICVLKTSRENPKRKVQRGQYLLTVGLGLLHFVHPCIFFYFYQWMLVSINIGCNVHLLKSLCLKPYTFFSSCREAELAQADLFRFRLSFYLVFLKLLGLKVDHICKELECFHHVGQLQVFINTLWDYPPIY